MSEITINGKITLAGVYYAQVAIPAAAKLGILDQPFVIDHPPADWHEGQEVTITIRSVEK